MADVIKQPSREKTDDSKKSDTEPVQNYNDSNEPDGLGKAGFTTENDKPTVSPRHAARK
jgi:hypothetical protein